jgi:hypothetical protein
LLYSFGKFSYFVVEKKKKKRTEKFVNIGIEFYFTLIQSDHAKIGIVIGSV